MPVRLSEAEIHHRLQDLRNTTLLHAIARERVLLLQVENAEPKKTVTDLERELAVLKQHAAAAEEERDRERDANAKLRALLFT